MQHSATILWKGGRALAGTALAGFIICLALVHTGGHVAARAPGIGFALLSLACILVGIWKGRTLEIVGWIALFLVVLTSLMG
jgi:hypothetical protein